MFFKTGIVLLLKVSYRENEPGKVCFVAMVMLSVSHYVWHELAFSELAPFKGVFFSTSVAKEKSSALERSLGLFGFENSW